MRRLGLFAALAILLLVSLSFHVEASQHSVPTTPYGISTRR